jgi:hypothetical protein
MCDSSLFIYLCIQTKHIFNFPQRSVATSAVKKSLPYNGRLVSAYNHLTCCGIVTARLGSLEMMSVDTVMCRSGKQNVVWYTLCSAQQLVNK